MTGKKSKLLFRLLLLLYLGAVAWLCFGHFENMPQMSPTFLGIPKDKIVHFLMFLPFPILFYMAFDRYTTKTWHSVLFCTVTLLLGLAVAGSTELLQARTDYRSGDKMDFLADALALLLATAAVFIIDIKKQIICKEQA